ncbi:MAG: hypothetical protein PHI73_01400 [Patescibacteria group bacterium]|nr:hypothetical protein [Patescibacteria group bacterium]
MFNENKFYLNKERTSPDAEEQERIRTSKEAVNEVIEERAQSVRERSVEFSPEMERFIAEARTWHEERFRKLGIDCITWGKNFFKVREVEGGTSGSSGLGINQIKDLSTERLMPISIEEATRQNQFLPIEVPDEILSGIPKGEAARQLRNYVEALFIAHELYHDAAPTSVLFKTETDETTGEKYHVADSLPYDRHGVRYIRRTEHSAPPAVEEGLAMTIQKQSEGFAAQHFPEGARIYQKLLDYVVSNDPRLKDYDRSLLSIRNFDGHNVRYGPMQYLDGYILTTFLSRQIPKFFEIIEQARINGKVLPLARAVENKFGRGSYKRIFTAGEDEALNVLEEIREKVDSKQK